MGYMTSQYRKVEPARIDQRDAVREPVLLQLATIRRRATGLQQARLVELSVFGCRLIIDGDFKIGERIALRFSDHSPVNATVVWCENNRIGCRFNQALDRGLFRDLVLQCD
jgi:hypothetical protein